MSDEMKLLPCPFCGIRPSEMFCFAKGRGIGIMCRYCEKSIVTVCMPDTILDDDISKYYNEYEKLAIKKWNSRV